jgi:ornithine cyclodeaminase
VIEFSEVVSGSVRPRENDRQITIFDSVGFALEDFSALRYLERLHNDNAGSRPELDLIPLLRDPKDLFAELDQTVQVRPRIRAV